MAASIDPFPVALNRLTAMDGLTDVRSVATGTESFEQVYAAHYRDVERYVLLMLGRPDDADGLVADTFQRAFLASRAGRGPAGRPLPWLLLIARRLVADRVARCART